MKKKRSLHLLVLTVLIVFASSCSQKAEYTHAIPADATQLISINLMTLAEKAGIKDKENKEALNKLTDAMKSGMNATTFQHLESVMKDPAKSGLDMTAPVYFFNSSTFDHATIVAKVSNENDLKTFLEVAQKEQLSTPIASGNGYSFAIIEGQAVLAFNANTFLAVSCDCSSDLDKVKEGIANLLKQTDANSIVKNSAFKKMQKMSGDINALIASSDLVDAYTKQLKYNLPTNIELKDLMIFGSLSFEKGKIEMQIECFTENKELEEMFEKRMKSTCPIENTFIKYFPKSTIALLSLGVNGQQMYNLFMENEDFRKELPITKAPDLQNIFTIFESDLTIGLIDITMSNIPSFLAYASVKNSTPLKNLYEKKAELREDLVKLSEDEYVYKTKNMNLFFGVRDKQMYATNDELLYKNICKPVEPSIKDTDFASELKGKRSGFVINAEAVLQLPVVKMLGEYGGQEYNTFYSLANNISYLEATSDDEKATITLQLKDKNVNALKQIVNFVKEFAGM